MFASRGVGKRGVSVHVKPRDWAFSGWAYQDGRIMLLLGPRSTLGPIVMQTRTLRAAYPTISCGSWRDAVVYLAAHEFRHIHQFRYWGGHASEVDADEHAVGALNRWRVETGREPIRRRWTPDYL